MNRQSSTIIWLVGTALAVLLGGQVRADDYGTIVLTRDVQPRAATRKEMVPDPNPKVVYGSPDAYLAHGVSGSIGGEISDSEFASINTGMAVTQRLLTGQSAQSATPGNQRITSATSGIGGKAGGGSATGGIAGRVNQSVQQGLRPLSQAMGQ